jgi:membrane protein
MQACGVMVRHSAWQFVKRLTAELVDSRLENGAAALAFYSMLALFPAAIFGLSLMPYLPLPNLQQAIFDLLGELLPHEAAELFNTTVQRIISQRHTGLLSFGLLFAIWSASSGIVAVMEQLDVVHRAQRCRNALRARGVAVLLLFPLFALIVLTFGLVICGAELQKWLASHVGTHPLLLGSFAGLRFVIIAFALLAAFAFMYRIGPSAGRPFRLFSPGTIFATLGVAVASLGFKLYVERFGSYDAIYGSLGAVIVLLLWLFVTGWVFLLGAAIDEFLAQRRASAATCEPLKGSSELNGRRWGQRTTPIPGPPVGENDNSPWSNECATGTPRPRRP